MLIVFPVGLLATAVIFDLIYLLGDRATMAIVSCWMIAAGVIGGLVAAPFGWLDWFAIPPGTPRQVDRHVARRRKRDCHAAFRGQLVRAT